MGARLIDKNRHNEAVAEAMHLWDLYGERYRNLLPRYHELLQKKREYNLRSRVVNKRDIDEFPQISFLYIENRDEAHEYLLNQTTAGIHRLCNRISEMVETNYSYRTLVTRCNDLAAELRRVQAHTKSIYAKESREFTSGFLTRCKRTGRTREL